MLGWLSNWRYAGVFPSAPWRGAMSLPRRLSLRTVGGAPRLVQQPPSFVDEHLAAAASSTVVGAGQPFDFTLSGHSLIELEWEPESTGTLRLQLRGGADALVEFEHDPCSNVLRITRGGSAMEAVHLDFPSTSIVELAGDGPVRLLLSLDGPLLEVFANDGEATASNLVVLGAGPIEAILDTERHGPISVTSADVNAAEGTATPALAGARD
jgi:levanase/fructan beta-fructosidase/levanbiose-producing levanase